MRFAPFAVAALIFDVTALFGWGIFEQLSWFVIVVIVGCLLHQFAIFAIFVRIFANCPTLVFFRKIIPVMVTALSTSSSAATLPTTIYGGRRGGMLRLRQ